MGNLDNTVCQKDTAPLLQSLVEGKELEKWQQHFCRIADVFVCCVDGQGTLLTEFDGNRDEIDRIKQVIDKGQFQSMLLRVAESTLEDQAIETTAYPNLRLAVIPARSDGKPVFNWLVCGVLLEAADMEDYENPPLEGFCSQISEKQFLQVVDMLRDISDTLIRYKLSVISIREQNRQSLSSRQDMEENLRRLEALTDMIQLLESEDAPEAVIQKLLGMAGNFLTLSAAALYRESKKNRQLNQVSGWCEKKSGQELPRELRRESYEFLKVGKTLVLSQNSLMNAEEKEQMKKLELKAVIVMPVVISRMSNLYVCFGEKHRDRVWQIEEIKFLNDAVKILKSICKRFRNRN